MSLPGGTKLGTFEIVRLLGAGGMGEVYLAHDQQLNRDVAVKVVRPEFTGDPRRLARFAQEARAASALSHPNICHIYHFDETTDGQRYIAMEYVDGETLDDRLIAANLPLREALDIAIQIAAALTAAHGAGIVHRDIKPANVKIRHDRLVKVLDFGLAKLAPSAIAYAPRASTQTAVATDPGTVVGTIDYMSPEQARGQEVDARTDIWALGVVLYEMVAGRSPFSGTSRSDVLVAILDREPPPLSGVTPSVPAELERIVGKALRKNPEQRYQVMKDLLLDLEALRGEIASPSSSRAFRRQRRGRMVTIARLGVAVLIAALAVLAGWWITHRPAAGVHYTLDLMLEGLEVGGDMAPELSPDGQWLLYRASGRLWRRALNELTSRPLPDSTGATYPFWSPDSRQVAFVRDRKLWTLPVNAANATLVGDAPEGLSGTGAGVWTTSGDLIIAGSDSVGLLSAPAEGGTAREIMPLDKSAEIDFHQVAALPDGGGLLVAVHRSTGSDTIAAFANGSRRTVLQLSGESIDDPVYSPTGHLLFARATTSPGIWAVRFSVDRLTTEGAPFLVAAGGWSPSIAANGTLAFVQSPPVPSQLVWIDRRGAIEPVGALHGPLGQGTGPVMALSPDGRRLAHSIDRATGTEVWSYDLSRGVVTRLSVGATRVTSPIWTPDGHEVVFGAFARGRFWNVYSVPSNDTRAPARVLPASAAYQWPCTISPDGRWLIYAERTGRGTDLWLVPRHQSGPAQPLLNTPFNEDYAKFSPDGQSLLYLSDESGQREVYVRAFPVGSDHVQVSTNGGSMPMWAPDGREIFYRTPTALMAVTVSRTARGGLAASAPQQLFRIDPESRLFESFVVAPNGRFLFARAIGHDHVSVILNWSHAVAQRAGAP